MNRTLEKEIAAFAESLRLQLARLIEEVTPYLEGETKNNAVALMDMSVIDLWRQRQNFDPMKTTLPVFFGAIVKHNVREAVRYKGFVVAWDFNEEEAAVKYAVRGEPQSVLLTRVENVDGVLQSERAPKQEFDPPIKLGKECPPCWKCRYFYGWLPVQPLQREKHTDREIEEACWAIDQRKVAIAHRIRGNENWTEAELQQE